MTFERFKVLWDALITHRPVIQGPGHPILIDGCSPGTVDALCRASHGDFAAFEQAEKIRCNLPQQQSRVS